MSVDSNVETATRNPSGKQTKPDNSGDIRDLYKQMKLRNILQVHPGRTHAAFPDLRKHLLEGLDVEKMAEWHDEKIEESKSLQRLKKFK